MEHGLSVHPLLVRYLCFIHQKYIPNFSKVNRKKYHCICCLCLDLGHANNGERCRNICQFHGPLSKEKSVCRTVAGQNQGCTPTGEFIGQCFQL